MLVPGVQTQARNSISEEIRVYYTVIHAQYQLLSCSRFLGLILVITDT